MGKAADTRMSILQKAFELIYINGYQITSIDDIIAQTKVTKGAFYYHFKNKDEMGLAVIAEVMMPVMKETLVQPLESSADPVRDIYAMMRYLLLEHPLMNARYGCPAGNLIQEMSPLNAAFSEALALITRSWQDAVQKSIRNGKKAGNVGAAANGLQVAAFVIAGYWGVRTLGKLSGDSSCYYTYLKELKRYLEALR